MKNFKFEREPDDDPHKDRTHFYEVFINYRFLDSFRNTISVSHMWEKFQNDMTKQMMKELPEHQRSRSLETVQRAPMVDPDTSTKLKQRKPSLALSDLWKKDLEESVEENVHKLKGSREA